MIGEGGHSQMRLKTYIDKGLTMVDDVSQQTQEMRKTDSKNERFERTRDSSSDTIKPDCKINLQAEWHMEHHLS